MDTSWTKPLVQAHARAAVSVELYTLPFYLTAMSSIKDPDDPIAGIILSVAMEEMLHLQLAANLCVALDTTPPFTAPAYGQAIPFLDPNDPDTGHNALINAELGPFDQKRLQTMLDIESPDELEDRSKDHTTPDYPYQSIGEMYDALLAGMAQVGPGQFSWKTDWQLADAGWRHGDPGKKGLFKKQQFPLVIASLADAWGAVKAINEQGEGKVMNPVPTPPYSEDKFPVEPAYVLSAVDLDPAALNNFSHFGRFIAIRAKVTGSGWPATYTGVSAPATPDAQNALSALQADFAKLLLNLNSVWTAGTGSFDRATMDGLLDDVTACWTANVIPRWS
jgi:hypothetical protein